MIARALLFFGFAVNASCDVGRLLADRIQNRASRSIKTLAGFVIADIENDLSGDVFYIDPGRRRDLTGDNDHAGLDHGFTGDACLGVFGDDRVKDAVGNLVGNLIRVPLRY